jgi:hypothetical protein
MGWSDRKLLYFPITKVGERRHNYVGAPDNRIEGPFRTCPNAPGTRHKPGTWTRWSRAHQDLFNRFYAALKAKFFNLTPGALTIEFGYF